MSIIRSAVKLSNAPVLYGQVLLTTVGAEAERIYTPIGSFLLRLYYYFHSSTPVGILCHSSVINPYSNSAASRLGARWQVEGLPLLLITVADSISSRQ